MAAQPQPRFRKGDQVLYLGSVLRFQGWQFEVTSVQSPSSGEPRYSLHNDADKIRLHHVRESSLLGPENDPLDAAAL